MTPKFNESHHNGLPFTCCKQWEELGRLSYDAVAAQYVAIGHSHNVGDRQWPQQCVHAKRSEGKGAD